eukprot:Protomagalhaensia_wolfi_Nauph_80__1793@NODE_2118_length_1209_cov_7_005983_g1656_i0_p1_GENE_NODE_2118_length_1209_cov_7_005983_g1656_i0NODE_2118_length_1209_cov_7_005983_g1656_i0_p1_ORF_typecomplete_len296_score27_76Arf/PF00025_21/1_5e34Gtr1_RagA/PF04670_12/4_7e12Galpha/PF00503_20/7_2Galpha/PF00503_20/6_3e10Ras/PF00071_22/4_3e11Roc/PF08477_13/1_3e09SRPRB/PF09439_10/5_8e09GTP_EFTU/PF00009_27/0_0011MMR_HSR1/PF01926_23/0_00044FeoB_N/PF02421_18/0_004_NODE_2118_length_1209_cov_7_005983_g1656_i03051192
MFSLLSGFIEWFFTKPHMRFLVLGLDNAGKTTTLEVIKTAHGQRPIPLGSITPTVGLNIAHVDSDGVSASFWDLGGQVALRTLWSKYFEDCQGILYVCDISDVDRYTESINSLLNVTQHRAFRGRIVPVLLFFNKVDSIHPADRLDRFRYCLSIFGKSQRSPLAGGPLTLIEKSEDNPLWHRIKDSNDGADPEEVKNTVRHSKDPGDVEDPELNAMTTKIDSDAFESTAQDSLENEVPQIVRVVAGSALSGAAVGRILTKLLITACKHSLNYPHSPDAQEFLVIGGDGRLTKAPL